ncbi:MAG: dTDP-glucose 4,6-dehydratase [Armatimonadota bacterium]|nr:dTDP-glucose 4,6-dehydratase [Armatimonadota bacterium]
MIKRLLVTGGAGFIGSSFIRQLFETDSSYQALNLDKLTYAGNLENLSSLETVPGYRFFRGAIEQARDVDAAFRAAEEAFGAQVEAVVHFAAESHVDRSIEDPSEFLTTNVVGTQVLLEAARRRGIQRFIHVSTDEVYGSLGDSGAFSETTSLAPNSPYAASKAGSDLIARAYFQTYGLPVIITRCSNNYGPYQFPEKLIPLMIANALEDMPLPVYGDGQNVRDWIYVDDHSRAIRTILQQGVPGEVYNIGGSSELPNLQVVRAILNLLGKPESLIQFVPDRPGHDQRYAMDATKLRQETGWTPRTRFEEGIRATVEWYLANTGWMSRVRSGAYQQYYERLYENRQHWIEQAAGARS